MGILKYFLPSILVQMLQTTKHTGSLLWSTDKYLECRNYHLSIFSPYILYERGFCQLGLWRPVSEEWLSVLALLKQKRVRGERFQKKKTDSCQHCPTGMPGGKWAQTEKQKAQFQHCSLSCKSSHRHKMPRQAIESALGDQNIQIRKDTVLGSLLYLTMFWAIN